MIVKFLLTLKPTPKPVKKKVLPKKKVVKKQTSPKKPESKKQPPKLNYSDDEESAGLLKDDETGLRGRPDQIVIVDGEFIPMEQKTGKVPDKPHKSHQMQLLAYLHLVETTTGRKPPYGVIRYGSENIHQIIWDEENYNQLMDMTKEIQRIMVEGGAKRNHERIGKCQNCSRRYACDSSLA